MAGVTTATSPIGRYGPPNWLRLITVALAAMAWTGLVLGFGISYFVACELTVLAAAHLLLGPTNVRADGARVALLRRPFHRDIAWSDVDAVVVAAAHESAHNPRLRLGDGSVVQLRYVPAGRGPSLAELAGARLVRGSTPRPTPTPTPARPPTPAQVEADLVRRAAVLAEHNAELRATLEALRTRPRPGAAADSSSNRPSRLA